MAAVQSKYLVMLITILIMKLAFANPNVVQESRLVQCYNDHPFLMQALMLISDEDYINETKSNERKKIIKAAFEKNPTGIRACVDDVVQYAKEQNDPENLKYIIFRLKEIASIVYAPSSIKEKVSPGAR